MKNIVESSFIGSRVVSLEGKGRITIPPLFNKSFVENKIGLFLYDKTIYGIIPEYYEKVLGHFLKMGFFDRVRQDALSSFEEKTIDNYQRILIPQYMRKDLEIDYAGANVLVSGNIEGLVIRKFQ